MIIERKDHICFLVTSILRRQGHEVTEAADGAEALLALERSSTIDLIITDVVMPNTDSIELIGQVRQQAPNLPILVMAATQHYINQTITKGANYQFLKPYSYSQFLSTMDTMLNREIE